MSEKLEREIKKLEIRVNNLIEESKILVKDLKELKNQINQLHQEPKRELRIRIAEKIRDTINSFGRIEHIFSHILESHGEIIVILEKELSK